MCSTQQLYATTATASSTWSGSAYFASQATGEPSWSEGQCSTNAGGSWAPAASDMDTHTLTLGFERAVYVSALRVWEAANPSNAAGFVQRVDMVEPSGTSHLYWEEDGEDSTACGGIFLLEMSTTYPVIEVTLTTQTRVAGWEYVDAVRLDGTVCFSPPPPPPSPRPPPPSPRPPPPSSLSPPAPCLSGMQQLYATTATASSQWSSSSYFASQATGEPSWSEGQCSTNAGGSWAPAASDMDTHTLTLGFERAVYVSALRVWEAANPSNAAGFVQRVDMVEPSGTSHLYWEEDGEDSTACGGIFLLEMSTTYPVIEVTLTTQTRVAGWEYVDAVRLDGITCQPPPPRPPPPPSPSLPPLPPPMLPPPVASASISTPGDGGSKPEPPLPSSPLMPPPTPPSPLASPPLRSSPPQAPTLENGVESAVTAGSDIVNSALFAVTIVAALVICAGAAFALRKMLRGKDVGADRLRAELRAAGVPEADVPACCARLSGEGIDSWRHLVAVQPSPRELEQRFGLQRGHAHVLGVACAKALVGRHAPRSTAATVVTSSSVVAEAELVETVASTSTILHCELTQAGGSLMAAPTALPPPATTGGGSNV